MTIDLTDPESSLVRHWKRCVQGPTKALRQKSCGECVVAKTRCDLRRPTCSRCAVRQVPCQYTTSCERSRSEDDSDTHNSHQTEDDNYVAPTTALPAVEQQLPDESVANDYSFTTLGDFSPNSSINAPPDPGILEGTLDSTLRTLDGLGTTGAGCTLSTFTGASENQVVELALPVLPSTATIPVLAQHSMEIMLRVFRTWPRMMAKGTQLPPIIHSTQVPGTTESPPLANCFTLVKMWDGQYPGTSSIVKETLKKEMQSLLHTVCHERHSLTHRTLTSLQYQAFDETNLLAALQALVIYTLMLLFPSKEQCSVALLEDDMFSQLRHLVYHVAATGLVLQEETDHVRPSWKAWIHVTSKRRVLLALYLIHWSYSVYHCLPSFDCGDLGLMPAPAAKYLWQATDIKQWESLYNRWLVKWDSSEYYQWEFHNISTGIWTNPRAEMWLEDADEFGMLFVSIGKIRS